jgi:hypothetical protein
MVLKTSCNRTKNYILLKMCGNKAEWRIDIHNVVDVESEEVYTNAANGGFEPRKELYNCDHWR